MTEPSQPVIALRGVSKRFGATEALRGVDLPLYGGEIHVVAGENGAGKSTLIRVIAGVHAPDAGQLLLDGHPHAFASPSAALAVGISTIHQELSLVGPMSICDNLHLGIGGAPFERLDKRRRHERARAWLDEVGLSLDPRLAVEQLPLASRQLVEIARALRRDLRLLILDEPTSALSSHESERLLERLEQLRARGCALLYVSHRSEELERLADRVTVLRDGEAVASGPAGKLSMQDITRLMAGDHSADKPSQANELIDDEIVVRPDNKSVGEESMASVDEVTIRSDNRDIDNEPVDAASDAIDGAPPPTREASAALQLRDLVMREGSRRTLDGVALTLHQGEILGLAGLRGSGAQPLLYALMGTRPASMSLLRVAGERVTPEPRAAIAAGMVLLSGDRSQSVLQEMSVLDNAGLSSLARFSPWGWLRPERLRRAVRSLAASLMLRAPSLDSPAAQLSGGNQQKVALMRAMLCRPRVLLLDDATRGIDVRAKAQVHQQIRALAERGVGVLMVSSDTEELAALCSRVLVMESGRVRRELSGAALSRQAIVAAFVEAAA